MLLHKICCYVKLCRQLLWLAVSCQGSAIHFIPDGFWSRGWECCSADHLRSTSRACGHRSGEHCAVFLDNRLCINSRLQPPFFCAGSLAAMWLCSSQWTAAMGFQVGRHSRVLMSLMQKGLPCQKMCSLLSICRFVQCELAG